MKPKQHTAIEDAIYWFEGLEMEWPNIVSMIQTLPDEHAGTLYAVLGGWRSILYKLHAEKGKRRKNPKRSVNAGGKAAYCGS